MELWMAIILSMLVGLLGGALHIIIPPTDTDKAMWTRRLVAGLIVGLIAFFGGLDPRLYEVPSAGIVMWFGSIMATGYAAIDVLKAFLDSFIKNPPTLAVTAQTPNK